mmetsp:Transcript_40405/g.59369  ORF Transcript_40405/g.59369 Transcript_40405/m.59369 type:complete len:417 (+) Transcript_40405:76-1326(+)
MDNFFKNLADKTKAKNKPTTAKKKPILINPQFKNPFAPKFSGSGNSLGGAKPGSTFLVAFEEPGSVGVRVEKTESGGCIISEIVAGGYAERLGLLRGDLICIPGVEGKEMEWQEEMKYDQFLALAKSQRRPLIVQIRRVQILNDKQQQAAAAAGGGGSASNDARRRAVIAAAEERERQHKSKTRPVSRSGDKKTLGGGTLSNAKVYDHSVNRGETSEETKRAVADAKASEFHTAERLGYNPYEAVSTTGTKGKNAVVATQHGAIQHNAADSGAAAGTTPGVVAEPTDITNSMQHIHEGFDEAFVVVTTSNTTSDVKSSISIMRKLMNNAITKGQDNANPEKAEKFRKVRLSNPKIKAAIVDTTGALDLMMSAGFSLVESSDEGETYLIYGLATEEEGVPSWIPLAVKRMELYEKET